MATLAEWLEAQTERHLRIATGIVAAFAVGHWGTGGSAFVKEANWKIDKLYPSAFDVSAIFTAFLFTSHTLFVTTEHGFVGRMRETHADRSTVTCTLRALRLGSALVLASVVMMLKEPSQPSAGDPWSYAVAAWAALTVWTVLAFRRAARMFSLFVRPYH